MQMSLVVLLLVGVSASFAKPTSAPAKPSMKDAVRMLLESSELLQTWGNNVLDASKSGLTAVKVEELTASGANARQGFHDTVEKINLMIKENGGKGVSDAFHKVVAEGAVEMLKEEAGTQDLTEDDKLALLLGDKLSVDTMRLRTNMNLFARAMEIIDTAIMELEGLLEEEVTDLDILEVLPEIVEELGSEGTALCIVFKAIEESFDDATDAIAPLVEDEMKNDADDDVDDDDTAEVEVKDDDEDDEEDTPSRQRRSPRRSSSFGSNSRSSFGSSSSRSSFGSRSRSSFGSSSSSGFRRDLGRGWSIGTDGVSWSNRRGNVHVNAGPTFGSGGIGGRIGVRIEF